MPDKIDRETMAGQYGFALAFMNSNPELKKLFNQAVKETWDPNRFIARLRGTKWFKNHSASVRNAILQQKSDPATYEANVDKMFATLRDTWGQMYGARTMNQKQLRSWAETAHRLGWSEAQLVDRMTRSVKFRKELRQDQFGGTAAEVSGQIDQLLSAYGVSLGNKWKAAQLERVMKGNDTMAGVMARVKDIAKREYAGLASYIDSGQTIEEIAEPYMQIQAQLLELNPAQVKLKDKMVQRALKARDKDGKPAMMSLSEYEDMIRQDSRWQYTDNAREQAMGVTEGLLKQFGLIA